MVDGVQAVAVDPVPPADICGGGQGSACDLASMGAAAPIRPADVIRKSLRVDMLSSPCSGYSSDGSQTVDFAHYIGVTPPQPCLKGTTGISPFSPLGALHRA